MRLKTESVKAGITMEQAYKFVGITRQGFHEKIKRHEREKRLISSIELLVNKYRKERDRRAGSRSLYHNLEIKSKYNLGVTRFERLLSENKLCLAPLRIKIVTTKSDLQSWNYANMISGKSISNINQVVAGDLTYVYLGTHLYYVFSLMDLYSNRIVGMSVSERMRAKDALEAYFQWKSLRNGHRIKGCVHHTDGGSQYFSSTYLSELKSCEIQVSRAKTCLENGYAEQWNGLLKNHFIPTIKYQNVKSLTEEIKQITYFYNNERKQEQLGWQTPVQYETYIGTLSEKQKPVKRLYNFEDPKR